ncbi:AcrR family transcriptional regulator [Prauserella isguenensis]|uniref:AcrR family transcriptional regulator n=1 Tax=Prauserella isguenensis TaxID=1470180 RepID=A0A839S5E5_9PSEU|nr:TetR/AcrR family transcriptional regulator [Prauserella isguenensis]MBB3052938.1 AcrR family transcriptional regulator [Prauserella isguenensis]
MGGRRDVIVTAAREIAAQRGMAALSVRTVAARAGVGASTLRHYFPSQRDLYDAVAEAAFDDRLGDLRIRDNGVPASDRLVECLRQFVTPADGLEQWAATVAAVAGPDAAPERRSRWMSAVRRAHERVHGWLDVLAEEGALRDGDPVRQARQLLLGVDGAALWLLTSDAADRERETDEILRDLAATVLR